MGIETFNYVGNLVATNPASGDDAKEGDDHIRGIKTTLVNSFPAVTGAVTSSHTELNQLDGVTFASGIGTFLTTPTSANLASAVTNETGSGLLVFGTSPTLTTPVLTGPKETKVDLSTGTAIDCAAGSVFTKTISGGTSLTVSNVASANSVTSFILELTNPSTNVTFWSGATWPAGAAPVLSTTGTDVIGAYTYDGGTTWRLFLLGKGMS